MLGKTAGGLFWMFRYLERSEYLARLVEAGFRMGLTSSATASEWESIVTTAAAREGYLEKYDAFDQTSVTDYLLRDPSNPSSVLGVVDAARNNARLVRTAITREVWEAVNDCWITLKDALRRPVAAGDLPDVLASIRQKSSLVRGALHGTMLRNDIFNFARAGTFVERADNTARILDVKYHVLLPSYSGVGGLLDYYQWTSILRSVSAVRAYQWVYRDEVKPWNVAELLLLRPEMPRSLRSCYDDVAACLDAISTAHGGTRGECHRRAGAVAAKLRYARIDDIFQSGLHEYLTEMIDQTAELGDQIHAFYMK